ncbi:MAG: cytochrome c [Gemmatimonadota bacterium]
MTRPTTARRCARLAGLMVVAAFISAGCTMEPRPENPQSGASDAAMVEDGNVLPSHAPDRFDFGAEASAARVAMWDIDVRPDGEGLPPGQGSVAEGREVYMIHCVACHGPTGTEGPNDRLVDSEQWDDVPTTRTVGNYWPYATTLYDYIRKAMPQLTPGILTEDQVYAVIAYILHLNEIVPEDAVMNAETLPAVVMPARDKFVVDDRIGGTGVVR